VSISVIPTGSPTPTKRIERPSVTARWTHAAWLIAIVAAIFEMAIAIIDARSSYSNVTMTRLVTGVSVRGVTFGVAIALALKLRSGGKQAHIVLTSLLGSLGVLSLFIAWKPLPW